MKNTEVTLEKIVSLAKQRGFIYQGSEVYGGLSGTWDYGPLGLKLRKNIENLWWKTFVDERDDMYGVDAAILMNKKTWEASGHASGFTDPLAICSSCKQRFRVDKIVDEAQYKEYINDALIDFMKEQEELYENNKHLADEIKKANQPLTTKVDEDIDQYNKVIEAEVNFEVYQEWLEEAAERIREDSKNLKGHTALLRRLTTHFNILSYVQEEISKARRFLGPFAKQYLDTHVSCSNCGNNGHDSWYEPNEFNMMFETNVGPVLSKDSTTFLRPETAQGIFTNYKNVVDSFYPDLPFGIAQIGKAFRNEISPRDFVFRSREFNQMEIEYFIREDNWQELFAQWQTDIRQFLVEQLGLDESKLHEEDVVGDELAHYSKKTIDFNFDFPHGRDELLGLAYRTDFDLKNIQENSGKSMEYQVKGTQDSFIPHVIEPSFGVERAVMAVLTSAYTVDEIDGNERTYLALPEHLAPVRYAVSPLLKNKPKLVEKAREVYKLLHQKHPGRVMWDDSGNIGKRYRRQDQIGTPECVVIDFETIEDDGKVTVRDRNTAKQQRVEIEELV